jgi:hypothetical protein
MALTLYILKLSTKVSKTQEQNLQVPLKVRMTIKMQNGTLLKENNRRKT